MRERLDQQANKCVRRNEGLTAALRFSCTGPAEQRRGLVHDILHSIDDSLRATFCCCILLYRYGCMHTDTARRAGSCGTDMSSGERKHVDSSRDRYSTAVDAVGGSSYPNRQKMAPNRSPTLMA